MPIPVGYDALSQWTAFGDYMTTTSCRQVHSPRFHNTDME